MIWRDTEQHNIDDDDDDDATTRCEGRAHVTRRLAGATKYCGYAIRDVRETSDVIRETRVACHIEERDDVIGAKECGLFNRTRARGMTSARTWSEKVIVYRECEIPQLNDPPISILRIRKDTRVGRAEADENEVSKCDGELRVYVSRVMKFAISFMEQIWFYLIDDSIERSLLSNLNACKKSRIWWQWFC